MATKKEIFHVLGMGCAGCATKVQNALSKREGVTEAKVNFADSTVMIEYDTTLPPSALQKTVEETGYELIIENEENQSEKLQQEEYRRLKRRTWGAILLSLPVFVIGMFFMHMPYANWIMLACTLPYC